MNTYETIACTECGGPTTAARPVCSLCEADKGLFAPPPAPPAPAPADPEFARWWSTPDLSTGHAPSASLDLVSAQKAWAEARTPTPVVLAPATGCPMKAFLDKLNSTDPAVRAEAEAHADRVADELRRAQPAPEPVAAVQPPVVVAGGQFEQVGTVWHERVNDEYLASLNDELVTHGEVLYRFVPGQAGSSMPAPAGTFDDTLNADEIARLRDALVWMGQSTYESLEECEIYRHRLVRRLISAVLEHRDQVRAERETESAVRQLKDHEIREAVNQLRDVALKYHGTQQLRSRIQEIVLPLVARG